MSWLIDTNITLRGLDRNHPHCRLVRRAILELKRRGDDLFLASQNLVEFWAVATRPVSANGLGMDIEWAAAQVQRMKRFFDLLVENPETQGEWERLVIQHRVSGKQVHDARLVATMRVHGIRQILTFNLGDFNRYPEIHAVSPEEVIGVKAT